MDKLLEVREFDTITGNADFENDEKYKYVSDDLYKNGIFDDNDNEIANNILRKVTIPNENKSEKNRKKNNDTRF